MSDTLTDEDIEQIKDALLNGRDDVQCAVDAALDDDFGDPNGDGRKFLSSMEARLKESLASTVCRSGARYESPSWRAPTPPVASRR